MEDDIEKQDCPACGNKALRKRSTPSLKNIKLRSVGNLHAPIVCDSCQKTFKMQLSEVTTSSTDVEQNSGIDW